MIDLSRRLRMLLLALVVSGFVWLSPTTASACYVCFGDPDSPMTKGAVMGVYVLGGVVIMVLVGVAGTAMFWMQRGRRLARGESPSSTSSS
jgi:hypothetical protein